MAPKSGRDGGRYVVLFGEVFVKAILCIAARLWESVHAFVYLDIYVSGVYY